VPRRSLAQILGRLASAYPGRSASGIGLDNGVAQAAPGAQPESTSRACSRRHCRASWAVVRIGVPPSMIVECGVVQLRKRRDPRARVLRRRRRRRRSGFWRCFAVVAAVTALTGALASSPSARLKLPTRSSAQTTRRAITPRSRLRGQLVAVKRLAYGLALFCGGHSRRMVALSFDDGPGPYTKLAIKKLRKAHLHATFFPVGKQIRASPTSRDSSGRLPRWAITR
jgi:Polysaccharide deacetylase